YNLFSICSLLGGENWILSIVSLYLIIIVMYIMIKIDLLDFFKNLIEKKQWLKKRVKSIN
ncbi:MAG: hypothetical protein KGD74_08760, partial [Candidatus Lokiarchaeota archaeon]|nr:hypothetical protein [Candidatus Lokiarchaeota archaeon]